MNDIGIWAGVALAAGIIAGLIGYSKHQSGGTFIGFFILGTILPLIGIVIALLTKGPVAAPQPPGWYPDPWGAAGLRWWDGREWGWQTHGPDDLAASVHDWQEDATNW